MMILVLYLMLTTLSVEINCQVTLRDQIVTQIQYNELSIAIVECDISKFKTTTITEKPYVMVLGVQRKLRSDRDYTVMAAYQPYFAPEHRKFVQMPPGESWDVTFTGGEGFNNKKTMKVVIVINSLDCTDTGLYRCYIHPPGTPYSTYSDPYNFNPCGKGENDIVKLKRYNGQLTAVVECDIAKFKDSEITVKPYLMVLAVQRKLTSDRNYTLMAAYQPYYAPEHRKFVVLPPGERWLVNFTGGEGWQNKNSMKVVITIQGVECSDSGLYRCYYFAPSEIFPTFSEPYNLSVKPLFELSPISITPKGVSPEPASSANKIGDNIQMRCAAKGVRELRLAWTFMSKNSPQEQALPPGKDVTTPAPVSIGGSNGCASYSHSTLLRFKMAATDDGKVYFCRAHYFGMIEGNVSFTMYLRQTSAATSGGERVKHHVTAVVSFVISSSWWWLWRWSSRDLVDFVRFLASHV